MKKLSILLAILFFAFTVEAQNTERSKRSKEKETKAKTETRSRSSSSKARKVATPSSSRNSAAKSTNSSSRAAKVSTTRKSSSSPAVRNSSASKSANSSSRTGQVSTARGTSGSPVVRNSSSGRTTSASAKTGTVNRMEQVRKTGTNSSVQRGNSGQSTRVATPRNSNSQATSNRVYTPRTGNTDVESRRAYTHNFGHRVKRIAPKMNYTYRPVEYRRVHFPYRRPNVIDIYWNVNMYRNYQYWYPDFNLWYYPVGYRIHTISAYDAYNYVGEVARIYGQINDVWYSVETGEYYLYIGGPYPYQDFTVIVEARDARRFSRYPEQFFTNRQIAVTGLVSRFEDKPEMFIKKRSQISLY